MRDFQYPGRSPAYGANGLAATSHPLATLAAIDVLRHGGNAADAAVTAAAVLCIAEPHMTGIGGDCFVLIGKPDGKLVGLNGAGRAAMAADADWLKTSGLREIGSRSIHAVTVPGAVDAWEKLLKAHGTMTLGDALHPAIALAEDGVAVAPRVAADWRQDESLLAADEGGRIHYLKDGRAPREGDIMHFKSLAHTLRLIAKFGRDEFYEGKIAAEIVTQLKERGSLLSMKDFSAARADWIEPIGVSFADHEILELPPSGQGLTALIALNILSQFGLRNFDPDSSERHHLEIEAVKLAWHYRNRHIGDPDSSAIPVDRLLNPALASCLAAMIDKNRPLDIAVALPPTDTIYLTVVDRNRLAVSFINSLYYSFGAGIVMPKSGIALHNRGACFSTRPGHPNCIGPGRRPLHTLMPAMARRDGLIEMAFGVMGGDYQPMGHVTVAVNRYIYGMNPQAAIDWPRYVPVDGAVAVEAAVPALLRRDLAAKGHYIVEAGQPLGGGQAIAIDHARGVLIGGSDFRKDGLALGY